MYTLCCALQMQYKLNERLLAVLYSERPLAFTDVGDLTGPGNTVRMHGGSGIPPSQVRTAPPPRCCAALCCAVRSSSFCLAWCSSKHCTFICASCPQGPALIWSCLQLHRSGVQVLTPIARIPCMQFMHVQSCNMLMRVP